MRSGGNGAGPAYACAPPFQPRSPLAIGKLTAAILVVVAIWETVSLRQSAKATAP